MGVWRLASKASKWARGRYHSSAYPLTTQTQMHCESVEAVNEMHKLELASTIHDAHKLNSALQVLSSGVMLSVCALAIQLSHSCVAAFVCACTRTCIVSAFISACIVSAFIDTCIVSL
jgi:hypothetical protein